MVSRSMECERQIQVLAIFSDDDKVELSYIIVATTVAMLTKHILLQWGQTPCSLTSRGVGYCIWCSEIGYCVRQISDALCVDVGREMMQTHAWIARIPTSGWLHLLRASQTMSRNMGMAMCLVNDKAVDQS